jgi:hypothetical protein
VPSLPLRLPLNLMEEQWSAYLNPLIASPLAQVNILTGVKLITGVNVINHLLQRVQQGWWLTDINANAIIYRSAAFNSLTLILTSTASCTVNIAVF